MGHSLLLRVSERRKSFMMWNNNFTRKRYNQLTLEIFQAPPPECAERSSYVLLCRAHPKKVLVISWEMKYGPDGIYKRITGAFIDSVEDGVRFTSSSI